MALKKKQITLLKTQKEKDGRNRKAEESRKKLKKSISEIQKDLTIPDKKIKESLSADEVIQGERYYIPSLDQEVTAISKVDKKGNVVVKTGIVKLTTHISKLEKIQGKKADNKVVVNSYIKSKAQNISPELNLIGKTVDEGVEILDKYLDDAYLSGIGQVRIVHGKGSGALRTGIHNYLKKHPHVSNYRLGLYGEGDSGVTIVELLK